MTIYSGTVISGIFELASGDSGFDMLIQPGGALTLLNGAEATATTVTSGGSLTVASGGIINDTTLSAPLLSESGYIYVLDGGVASGIYADGGEAVINVESGGMVENVTLLDANIYIYPGGNAKNINTLQWGRINGFICTDTHIDSIENGIVYIDGATAAGDAYVFSGSFANNIYVSLSAKLFVCDGGATDNVHIIDRGSAYIYSGGCMSNTTVDYSGMLVIYDGGRLSGTTTVAANCSVNGFAMNSATNIIDDGSRIHISGAYIHEWSAFADSNLELSDIRVIGGVLEVDCDSEIQDISIEQNGSLIVHSGANINDVINTGGSVIVAEDATVNNFIQNNYSHEIVVMSGAEINDMLVAELGSAIISGDGIINNAIVERGCSITMSGGTLDGFKNDGVIDLSGSAVAKDGTVTDYIKISSGAQVSNIDVKSGGIVYVSSGGMLNQSFINGSATVWGGMAEQLVIGSGGDVDIGWNSIVEQVVVNSAGKLSCLRSGYISDLTIKAGGQALLASGDGILVEYGGELYLRTPEGINDITLAGGRLTIYSDPSSLPIYVKSITFALSGETADAMINVNISNITCSQYYLSVAEGNSTQEYILCNNSNGFSQSITVVNSSGDELGVLAVGESLASDYGKYSLSEENGQLLLNYTAFVVNENISGLTATLKSAEELAAGESVTLTSVNYTVSDSQIGVFAGTNGVLDGGAANVTGNVAVTVTSTSGDGIGALYGGGLGLNQNIGGDVLLTLESGTYGYIYTGGYSAVTGNVKTVIGDVTVNNNIYGGTAYTNPDSVMNNVGGSTTVEISSGVILNQVYAGNYVNCDNSGGEVKSTVSGGSYLNISGGTFTGPVVMAGGVGVATGSGSSYVISEVNGGTHVNVTGGEIAYLYGGGRGGASTVNADYGASVVNDGSHITISGGDIKVVYGGGYCDAGYSYVNGGASITLNAGTIGTVFGGGSGTGGAARNSIVDSVNITVDATGDLSIADIYGGGNGRAQVSGDVTITLHGSNGHNLSINGLISGGGRNGVSGVGGDRTLQFEDYQGSLDATIVNFNTIRVNEYTEVALSKVQDFSTVDTFIFDAPMQAYDATAGMLLSGDTVWGGSKLLKLNVDSGVYDAEIVLLSNLGNDISSFADANYEFNVLGTLEDGYSSGVMSGIDLESGLGSAWYNEIDEAYYRLEIGEFDTLAGLDLRLKVIDAYSDEGLQLKAQLA